MKKYRTEQEGDYLRVIAIRDFAGVKAGAGGGLIKSEQNLSQSGNAWVSGNARVEGDARVEGQPPSPAFNKKNTK